MSEKKTLSRHFCCCCFLIVADYFISFINFCFLNFLRFYKFVYHFFCWLILRKLNKIDWTKGDNNKNNNNHKMWKLEKKTLILNKVWRMKEKFYLFLHFLGFFRTVYWYRGFIFCLEDNCIFWYYLPQYISSFFLVYQT